MPRANADSFDAMRIVEVSEKYEGYSRLLSTRPSVSVSGGRASALVSRQHVPIHGEGKNRHARDIDRAMPGLVVTGRTRP